MGVAEAGRRSQLVLGRVLVRAIRDEDHRLLPLGANAVPSTAYYHHQRSTSTSWKLTQKNAGDLIWQSPSNRNGRAESPACLTPQTLLEQHCQWQFEGGYLGSHCVTRYWRINRVYSKPVATSLSQGRQCHPSRVLCIYHRYHRRALIRRYTDEAVHMFTRAHMRICLVTHYPYSWSSSSQSAQCRLISRHPPHLVQTFSRYSKRLWKSIRRRPAKT